MIKPCGCDWGDGDFCSKCAPELVQTTGGTSMDKDIPEKYREREREFRAFTRAWIERQDKWYREVEQTYIAKHNKPLRHPLGREYGESSREYLWSDALWCQDRHSEPFEHFFYPDGDPYSDEFFSEMVDSQGTETVYGKVWTWLTTIFNEEFVKVCPDIAHVLEG